MKRLAQEREQLEEEIEQRKSAWEREWEELEQDREEAEHSLASFRGGLEAEKKAFYAMLEQEHAAFEAEKARCKEDWEQECAEKRRVLKKELHEAQVNSSCLSFATCTPCCFAYLLPWASDIVYKELSSLGGGGSGWVPQPGWVGQKSGTPPLL